MTDRQACNVEKAIFPLMDRAHSGPNYIHVVKEGLLFDMPRHKEQTIAYAEIAKMEFSPGVYTHVDLYLHTRDKHSYFLFFFLTRASNEKIKQLQNALSTLNRDAAAGKVIVCSDDPKDYAAELADFEQKTASWRALAEKPKISDEVYKDRLLAEDALKNRDLGAAASYYEAGVAAQPTWDQGWYNAALVYAEQKDYLDAAQCMHHYVILMPNAPDVQAAKDNIILWEAKAPQAAPAASESEPAKSIGTLAK